MSSCTLDVASLKKLVQEKEEELTKLRCELAAAEQRELYNQYQALTPSLVEAPRCQDAPRQVLTHDEVGRYSRQMILNEIGMPGQLLLATAKVLIVGCGGLGCPAAMYLAAAGIGTIGLLDYDLVEISNLHRQVLHAENRVGVSKADSVISALRQLNSHVKLVPHKVVMDSSNALGIINGYDVVLDCTDNVATRYLINDACVLSKKPLVSGAALRWDGQLTVYNYQDGPCYRCMYPSPPDPDTVTNCSDGGVIGAVPGIIGSLQALETIKIITKAGVVLSKALLIFDGFRQKSFTAKIRGKQPNCVVCSDSPTLTQLIDYAQFCGAVATDKDTDMNLLQSSQRISVTDYKNNFIDTNIPHVLLDIRQPVELTICGLPDALNIPLRELNKPDCVQQIQFAMHKKAAKSLICVCRRGNDSQKAVDILSKSLDDCVVQDIIGGLTKWAQKIDPSMPIY